jgi:hypothetical protein
LLDPRAKKVMMSKDVLFAEHKSWDWNENSRKEEVELIWEGKGASHEDSDDEPLQSHNEEATSPYPHNPDDQLADVPESSGTAAQTRERRTRRRPSYLWDYVNDEGEEYEAHVAEGIMQEPVMFEEEYKDPKWKKAMDDEISAIERNKTWSLVDLPKNTKCIRVKWVFITKLNEKGEIKKHKARLVAKGYYQKAGIDYTDIYAPVARMDTVRMMISLAAQMGWEIFQMDIKSAFLHGTLEEDVYIQQPQGYEVKGNENKVYKLHRSLYGLKQAPKAWFNHIESYLLKEGFIPSSHEDTLFIKTNKAGNILIIDIYVDDLIYTGDNEAMIWISKDP